MLRSSTSQNVPSPLVHNLLNEKMLKDVNKYLSSIVSAKVVVSQSDQLVWLVEVRSISHYTWLSWRLFVSCISCIICMNKKYRYIHLNNIRQNAGSLKTFRAYLLRSSISSILYGKQWRISEETVAGNKAYF